MKEFVKKKAVIVKDRLGLPNYMTMFYMEPGTYKEEDVPEMFKIRNKIVPAILISQYHNTVIDTLDGGVAVSLPFQQPKHTINMNDAAKACARKGNGWHLMTNAEFVYLLHEAEELGHTIGGNTNYGCNADNPQEKSVVYDRGRTLTGCDPLTWSHDGTAGGVFGICGNFWEFVTGLRLHKGVVEYTKDNDAAVEGYKDEAPDWTVAEVNGKPLKLYGSSDGGVVMSTAEKIEKDWDGCHIAELQLEELEDVPEIAYKLGIVPHDWKNETAGIWADSELEEAVPFRGSCFYSASDGGAGALGLPDARSDVSSHVSLRSALFLESWELVTDLLKAGAEAHAGAQDE